MVRGLFTEDEVETLRRRADEIGTEIEAYRQRDRAIRQEAEQTWAAAAKRAAVEQGKATPEGTMDMGMENMDPRNRPDACKLPRGSDL